MPTPDFYSGILGGFQMRQDQREAETRADADAARQRERNIYGTLLQSDDPELQHLALTGLLDSATVGKKKKGMAGWLGELEQAPAYSAIQGLLQSPAFRPTSQGTQTPESPTGTPTPTLNAKADPSAPLAQPNTALTEQQPGGPQPPPTPTTTQTAAAAPPAPTALQGPAGQSAGDQAQQQATLGVPPEVQQQAAGMAQADALQNLPQQAAQFVHEQTPKVQTGGQEPAIPIGPPPPPRVAFLSPIDRYKREQIAKASADVEGEVAGMVAAGYTREQALALYRRKIEGRAGALTPRYGGIMQGAQAGPGALDAYGRPLEPDMYYRTQIQPDGSLTYTPTVAPASQIGRVERMMMPNGRPGVYRVKPDGAREFLGEVPVGADNLTVTHADGSQEVIRVPKVFAQPTQPQTSQGRMIVGAPGVVSSAGQGGPAAGPTAPPAPRAVTGGGGTGLSAPLGGGGSSRGGIAIRPATRKEVKGTVINPDGSFEETTLTEMRGPDGKMHYLDPQTEQEVPGAVPRVLSASAQSSLQPLYSLDQNINAVLDQMHEAGLDENDDPAAVANFFLPYLQGRVGDDDKAAPIAALLNFVRVTGASPYMKGTRAYQWVQEIQSHLPRFISGTGTARIGQAAGAVGLGNYASEISSAIGGGQWDSGRLIAEKLKTVHDQIIPSVRDNILQMEGMKTTDVTNKAAGGPPPPAGAPDLSDLAPGHARTLPDGSEWAKLPDGTIKKLR